VNLVLLFCLTGLLSIPLALSPSEAWHTFSDTFIRCIVIFIVIVNVVRTEARLKGLLFLTLIVSLWLSLGAINDFRLNLTTVEGYRIGGRGSGIFGNSNDMALFLVTGVPMAIALFLGSRGVIKRILFGGCAILMMAAIVLTYSRGGFIGLIAVLAFIAWKVGRRQRLTIAICGLFLLAILFVFAPGNYAQRLASIFIPSLDPVGSSDMRREILFRSIWTALRHPLFGIGMGNFHNVSIRELVSHNAFTQVASEMGMAALICYTMFIVTPLKRLGQVARETIGSRERSRFYYLAIGLQASLLGYLFSSFFASVAYLWYVYYLVGYAVCLRRIYEAETGKEIVLKKEKLKGVNKPQTHSESSLPLPRVEPAS
jgi:O-antigen ligase